MRKLALLVASLLCVAASDRTRVDVTASRSEEAGYWMQLYTVPKGKTFILTDVSASPLGIVVLLGQVNGEKARTKLIVPAERPVWNSSSGIEFPAESTVAVVRDHVRNITINGYLEP